MSEFGDLTVARYLELDRDAARAYHLDPQVHAEVERLRQFVDATDRALLVERIPSETRRRVINRIVFGEPDGLEAAYVSRREQMQAMAAQPLPTADAWKRLLDPSAGSVRPDEDPTPSDGDPDTRCGDPYRTEYHGVARCSRGLGHPGVHAGHADDGTQCQWPADEPTV